MMSCLFAARLFCALPDPPQRTTKNTDIARYFGMASPSSRENAAVGLSEEELRVLHAELRIEILRRRQLEDFVNRASLLGVPLEALIDGEPHLPHLAHVG